MFLSCIGLMGKAGNFVGGALFGLLGLPAYVFPFLLFAFFMFAERILEQDDGISKIIGAILLILAVGLICEMSSADLREGASLSIKEIYTRCSEQKNGGGIIAGIITFGLYSALRSTGTILVIIVLILVGVTLISRRSIGAFLESQAAAQREHLRDMAEQRRIRREERELYEDEYDDYGYDDYPEQGEDAGAYCEDDYGGYADGYAADAGKDDDYYDGAAYEEPYPQRRPVGRDASELARKETAKERFRRLQEESRQRRQKKQEKEAIRAQELENQQILRRNQQYYSGVTLDTKLPDPDEDRQMYAEDGTPFTGEGTEVQPGSGSFDEQQAAYYDDLHEVIAHEEIEPDVEEVPVPVYHDPDAKGAHSINYFTGPIEAEKPIEDIPAQETEEQGSVPYASVPQNLPKYEASGWYRNTREPAPFRQDEPAVYEPAPQVQPAPVVPDHAAQQEPVHEMQATAVPQVQHVPFIQENPAQQEPVQAETEAQIQSVPVQPAPVQPAPVQPAPVSTPRPVLSAEAQNIQVNREDNQVIPETDRSKDSYGDQTQRGEIPAAKPAGQSLFQRAADVIRNQPKKYLYPPVTLLKRGEKPPEGESERELRETAAELQETLRTFGVNVTITDISQGPSVTRYELLPDQGVKVSRIVSLQDDIKMHLAATDIRIEAPIPGKSAIGIEVPNKINTVVGLRDILETDEYRNFKSKLAFPVGKDIAGKPIVFDIAKMPHVLIAGSTGSGKSVCINTIIMGILFKAKPEEVKLIMVDPKIVELSVYNGIPHLMTPVVTDPKKASAALNWAVAEMTERYKKFADARVRDLKGYNEKIREQIESGEEVDEKPMPQLVIIVDELADLMMVSAKEVEESICRLAQLARAAGIHLIIATQRPSVDVITGLIKANMPSRVAFAVSSGTDSRTILDMVGAEKLLGKGDMLFYPQGYTKPARVQGAFVSDREVSDVVNFLKENNPSTDEEAKELERRIDSIANGQGGAASAPGGSSGDSDGDELFEAAGRFIIESGKASIGLLQRKFKIGFNRAARIMDQLAECEVVSEERGTKAREILMTMPEFEAFLQSM